MKGDFSRIRFNPSKHYSEVLEQQGRVALDADANERSAIDAYLRDTTNIDVIGPYGCPIGDAGFEISVDAHDITIGAGRYYVEGLLVQNEAPVPLDGQLWLANPPYTAQQLLDQVAAGKGSIAVHLYLQVFQRLVTQLDEPCLREPALGQADTTARLQTVWRVVASLEQDSTTAKHKVPGWTSVPALISNPLAPKLLPSSESGYVDPTTELSRCCQSLYGVMELDRSGSLGADPGIGNNDCGCQPIASAGYQGLENQLYRVEIHSTGTLDTAYFKWSRENGSVVTAVTAINGQVVSVSSLGPDANLGYQAGQWVELSDDTFLFGDPPNQPGELYQIQSIGPGPLQVTLASPVSGIDYTKNARMRRWDQSGAGASSQGVALSSTAIQLENGIEVTFRKGMYQAGDYWTILARTASAELDWPPCGGDGQFFQPAHYTPVYYAPLACIHWRNIDAVRKTSKSTFNPSRFIVDDCRLKFSPLTALNQVQIPPALHVNQISWTNDDIMTVDTFLQNGLFITLDQPSSCPWSGANFRVTFEPPLANDAFAGYAEVFKAMAAAGKFPAGIDVFLRTVLNLDPPEGITVTGNQVTWLGPPATSGIQLYSTYWLDIVLNTMLIAAGTTGYGRVRVHLDGSAIYGDTNSGTIYLDGESFGSTGARNIDGSQCVSLQFPSGSAAKASDFEGWFYLAPTVIIQNVQIQGIENGNAVALSAVTVEVDYLGTMTGLQVTGTTAPVVVTAVQAVITLSYPPLADTPVTLSLFGSGVGTVVNMQATATVLAGKLSVTVPINIQASPGVNPAGVGNVDTVTLTASVATVLGNRAFNPPPTLAITGGPVPPAPIQ